MRVGDAVRYRELKDKEAFTLHIVMDVRTKGIPSCPEPMVKLTDKAGYVLASHCEVIEPRIGSRRFTREKAWED